MKEIIGIVIVSLMFCNIGYAKATKARILGTYDIKIKPLHTETVVIACISAIYLFILAGAKET